jgi:hypothetical protein
MSAAASSGTTPSAVMISFRKIRANSGSTLGLPSILALPSTSELYCVNYRDIDFQGRERHQLLAGMVIDHGLYIGPEPGRSVPTQAGEGMPPMPAMLALIPLARLASDSSMIANSPLPAACV